jgi:hypothetical protein
LPGAEFLEIQNRQLRDPNCSSGQSLLISQDFNQHHLRAFRQQVSCSAHSLRLSKSVWSWSHGNIRKNDFRPLLSTARPAITHGPALRKDSKNEERI